MIREEYDNGHQVMGNCRTDRSMFRSFNVLMMVYIGVCDMGIGLVVCERIRLTVIGRTFSRKLHGD